MSLTKRIGYDISLGYSTTNSGYTTLGSVINKVGGQTAKVEYGETTMLAQFFKSFLPSDCDPGELSFEIVYDPGDSNYQNLSGYFGSQTLLWWQITFSGGSPEVFQAYIMNLGREFEKKTMLTCPITLKISGDPGFTND